jgi:hypothetical protein
VSRSQTLVQPTDGGHRVAAAASAMGDAEPDGVALRLLGVQVSGLDKERPVQLGLFDGGEEDSRADALNAALDEIMAKFGPKAVKRGRT